MPSGVASSCPFTSAARTISPSRCTAESEIAKSSTIASKVHRSPRWFSLITSILGASNGVAPCRFASSSKSLSSTNKNSALGSMNFLINQGQATRSTLTSLRVIHFIFTSRLPRIGEFNRETIFVELRRVRRNEAGKTLTGGVDHEKIAIRPVIPAQPNVSARGLIIRRVHLKQGRKRQKTRERVVSLKTAENNRKFARTRRKRDARRISGRAELEPVPLLRKVKREALACPISGAHPRLIQVSIVVASEALKEIHCQTPVLGRAICKLVPRPVVFASRN